ncbi:hypothetical protein BKA62DRAFT_730075 [Auriculariales sp. MPI-PUGE-AT-0066]|nr:hypothetical protein BKA62DRAFT_730075 [Auriculariales sp. MPI-PUGE-AT-0066]
MLTNPHTTPRRFVQHIIFTGESDDKLNLHLGHVSGAITHWEVESATLAPNMTLKFLATARLVPRKLWCTGPTYSLVSSLDVFHQRSLSPDPLREFARLEEVRVHCIATGAHGRPSFNSWPLDNFLGVAGAISHSFQANSSQALLKVRLSLNLDKAYAIGREENIQSVVSLVLIMASFPSISLVIELAEFGGLGRSQYLSRGFEERLRAVLQTRPAMREKIRLAWIDEPVRDTAELARRLRAREELSIQGQSL